MFSQFTKPFQVDEMLPRFKGRCPFRVYMRNKPSKFGIKIWACADAATGFVLNMQVYTGMRNNQREVGQATRVVRQMVQPYYFTGRGVTTDQGFTSKQLAYELKTLDLSLVGTIKQVRREVPAEMKNPAGRQVFSSL